MELASQECCLHSVLFTRRYVTFVLVIITFAFTLYSVVGNTTVFHGRYSLFHTVGSIRWHSPHVFSSCVTRMSRYVANDN